MVLKKNVILCLVTARRRAIPLPIASTPKTVVFSTFPIAKNYFSLFSNALMVERLVIKVT